MRNLNIALLRTFLHVADATNMTTAAKRLNLTQGAVSQQMLRLEQMLDRTLLVRSKDGVQLSQRGEQLLPQFRQLVELNDALLASTAANAISGRVRFGVPHDLMGTHLPAVMEAFTTQYPAVEVVMVAASSVELATAFDSGNLELALTEQPAAMATGELLCIERLVWVGKVGGVAWQQRPLPVCLVSSSCVFRPALIAELNSARIAWRNLVDYPGLDATAAVVQADLAVTALLSSTVPASLALLGADTGLPALPPFAITLHAPREHASAACSALVNALRCAYQQTNRSHR